MVQTYISQKVENDRFNSQFYFDFLSMASDFNNSISNITKSNDIVKGDLPF